MTTETARQDPKSSIKSYFPILEWLPSYKRAWLRFDVIAALTVWALLVPEAMAYASLAGLPPEAGLYAAPLALLGYAIFGTSRQLGVGPSSAVAVMSAAVISLYAVSGTEEYIALSAALAMMVGLLFLISGFLKLGFLADFMSRPVMSGLVVGIALTIVAGQLDKLLGYTVPEGGFFEELLYFVLDFEMLHLPTLIISIISLVILFGLERIAPKFPAALVVVILGIVISWALAFEENGIHIVGEIPAGLPSIESPGVGIRDFLGLIPGAFGIVLVAFAESIAAARSYARKHNYEVNADQEMIALGVANFGAGMSQGFVVDGSLSRTAAADESGQKSQLASIINAVLILITAAVLTPLFQTLPEAVLGAVVIHAVWRLISFKELRRLYKIRRGDFWAALLALVGVLILGILGGLALAILLSFLILLYRASSPSWAILGRVPGEDRDIFADLAEYPDSETFPGLIIYRFDQQIFFANAPKFRDGVRSSVAAVYPPARVVLVDAEGIPDSDTTAMDMLAELQVELARSGTELWFARTRAKIMHYFDLAGLVEQIGPDNFHLSVRSAVDVYLEKYEVAVQQTSEPLNDD